MTQEEHDDLVDAAINDLLEALEQDVIADMYSSEDKPTKTVIAWNQAMCLILDRLKTYRKE